VCCSKTALQTKICGAVLFYFLLVNGLLMRSIHAQLLNPFDFALSIKAR
jgi:hypothetical protein